jgi:RNA polymerase sigma-70 factor (ECF subfamily)
MNESGHTRQVIEHLFRHESGRIVSILTRILGLEQLEIAEDVVQEALLKALQQWPYSGVPANPPAWIMHVAKNYAIDFLRREQNLKIKTSELFEKALLNISSESNFYPDDNLADDELRMMFACCHPALSVESQIALTLKTLCGFGINEISRAFIAGEETIHKRLVRAKQKLKEVRAEFEIPSGKILDSRLDSVMRVLYLLFNEGYNASQGDELIRKELCDEAIRLMKIIAGNFGENSPSAHALLALMLLHRARFHSRINDDGKLLLLQDQDRALWDKKMIYDGLDELNLSAEGEIISEYHLQAGIAACHCLAPNFKETNWERILGLYDMLIELNDSPVILLNRAVAISKVEGAEYGIKAIEEIKDRKQLDKYYLLYAALGDFYMALNDFQNAATNYRKALELTKVHTEQQFLAHRLSLLDQNLN